MSMDMGSMGLWHWWVLIILYLIFGIPVAQILRRVGYSGWWSVLTIVPLANLIGLWLLAFIDWPATRSWTTNRTA